MNKHIVKTDDNQPFHTSGYAQVANGNRVGAVSTMSFERRQQIDQNRQKIGDYRRSTIGRATSEFRPKIVISPISASTKPSLVEKPTPYNPYP